MVGVQDEESTSKITPLDELSPHHTKRRTDALFSLLKEEAAEQKITKSQLLGFCFIEKTASTTELLQQ